MVDCHFCEGSLGLLRERILVALKGDVDSLWSRGGFTSAHRFYTLSISQNIVNLNPLATSSEFWNLPGASQMRETFRTQLLYHLGHWAVALELLIGAAVSAQGQLLSKAPGAAVFTLTPAGYFTEPGIAVNPTNH